MRSAWPVRFRHSIEQKSRERKVHHETVEFGDAVGPNLRIRPHAKPATMIANYRPDDEQRRHPASVYRGYNGRFCDPFPVRTRTRPRLDNGTASVRICAQKVSRRDRDGWIKFANRPREF